MSTLKFADLYGGTTASGSGMADTEQASGGTATFTGGLFPAVWVVGLVIAMVLLRVAYEMSG